MTPLIVGAGPVGLAAGVFLAAAGVKVRVVERRGNSSNESRALAVNPRTLALLESMGVTPRLEAVGQRMVRARMYLGTEVGLTLEMKDLPGERKYMLALSQAVTERVLEERLRELGVEVERGKEVVGCEEGLTGARVRFADGEEVDCSCVLGSDGARSAVRKGLGIGFEGDTFERPWYLADLPLETELADDTGHAIFLDDWGFLFVIRVVDGTGRRLWRLISNRPEMLSLSPLIKAAGPAVWESEFRISHRMATKLSTSHVHLAGDAAHIHSPIGARGMNLGIEDACVFARLFVNGELSRYEELRRPVDLSVVRRVRMITRVARGESVGARFLRSQVLPRLARNDVLRVAAMRTVAGLDHEVGVDG